MDDKTGVIYEIPCHNCPKTYVGETGRRFGTRKKEHRVESEKMMAQNFTRATRKDSQSTEMKSSIAEHASKENHLINWDNPKILAMDDTRNTRWIRESIWIRRKSQPSMKESLMNGDEGAFQLSHVYDQLIQRASSSSDDVIPTNKGSVGINH